MLRKTALIILILHTALAGSLTSKASESGIIGRWITHKGGEIEIAPCGNKICGTIAKLARQDHETPPTDTQNPDPALRDRVLLGLTLISNFSYEGDDSWENGRIYNVNNGKTYKSKLRLLSKNRLKLSGCVFIFCRSYTWSRALQLEDQP